MGINTDLTRIKNAKSALKTAINAKGGTITDGKLDTYALQVDGLPSGGGPLPSDWPDIHAIVESDVQSGYSYKYIYLLADDYTYLNLIVDSDAIAFKTSDGAFYTATTTHNWNTALDFDCSEGYKTRWVIVYTNTENITVSLPYEVLWLDMYSARGSKSGYTGPYRLRAVDGLVQSGLTDLSFMFANCTSLTRVPDVLDLSSAIALSGMFADCTSLTRVPDVLDLSSAEDLSGMFANCTSLTRVPDVLDISSAIDLSGMFANCISLTRVPDVLDTSSAIGLSGMFNFCISLTRVPDVLDISSAVDLSYTFYNCYSLTRVPSLTSATGSVAAGCTKLCGIHSC